MSAGGVIAFETFFRFMDQPIGGIFTVGSIISPFLIQEVMKDSNKDETFKLNNKKD